VILLVCVILLLCVLLFSHFFYLGPWCYLIFPLWKLLTDPEPKELVKRQPFGSSAQQYGIFSRLCYIGNIGPEYKWYPGRIGYQHQVYISATFTAVMIKSARRQIVYMIHSALCAKGMIHICKVWVCYEYNLNLAMSWKQARMCYELSTQEDTPDGFQHKLSNLR
jgi:hypothetical protein